MTRRFGALIQRIIQFSTLTSALVAMSLLPVTAATAQVIERGVQGGVVGAIIGGIVGGGRGIADMLETGNTPDFDVVGGVMVPVQENMAKLKPEDRAAIAAFLKSLPPLPDAVPRKNKATDKSEEDDGEPADVAGAYVARPLSAASSALQGKGAQPGIGSLKLKVRAGGGDGTPFANARLRLTL